MSSLIPSRRDFVKMQPVPYALGIDLGTTYTAAAIARDGSVRIAELGGRSPVVPSVLFLGTDESVLVGDAAVRRAATEPGRVAREFKRRVGDPTPILLGGSPWSAEALLARLLRWTVDSVTEREGAKPTEIAVTHPANWGAYKTDLLRQAMRLADLDVDITLTEPEAAAISYAATERVAPGEVVAVYDLGGGTFDAAVLRKTADGFEILGDPEGIERLGGIDFDQAVFAFVSEALNGAVTNLDPSEPGTLPALARLRQECVEAKEALSTDTETIVPVILPGLQTEVLITRAEFEAMIRPTLADTLTAMRRALRSAKVDAADVKAVLLVGGSSRIPLVADLVSHELDRPVAVDLHPKHAVAQGAAIAADDGRANVIVPAWPEVAPVVEAPPPVEASEAPVAAVAPPAPPPPAVSAPPAAPSSDAPAPSAVVAPVAPPPARPARTTARLDPAAPPPPPPSSAGTKEPAPSRGRRRVLIGAIAAAVVVIAAAAVLLTRDNGATASAADCPPSGKPAVCIASVNVSGTSLLATFNSHDVQIADPLSGGAGSVHPIFFFNQTDPSGGRVWGPNSPFGAPNSQLRGFALDDRPASSDQLCVLLQDAGGAVFQGTGNCVALPSAS